MTDNELRNLIQQLVEHPQVKQALTDVLAGKPLPPQVVVVTQLARINAQQLGQMLAQALGQAELADAFAGALVDGGWTHAERSTPVTLADSIRRHWDW